MNGTVKGIIIRTTDYREKDKLVDIFTTDGIVTLTAKGVRNVTAKLKSISVILTYGDFSYEEGRGRRVLSGGDVKENFFPCWTDPEKYASAMICLELVEKLFKNEEETQTELVLCLKALGEIAYGNCPLAAVTWFSVKCAERVGCDYSVVANFAPDEYMLLSASADGTETGVVGARDTDFLSAIRALFICFKNEFGFGMTSFREAEKLFYRS